MERRGERQELEDMPSRNPSERRLAGGLGFEPRLAESESAVLPLDDPPKCRLAPFFTVFRFDSGPAHLGCARET